MSHDRTLNRILYVEDEPDIQAVAKLALEAVGGFQVEVCGSGQDALRLVGEYRPDLILLDVMMPGMDGPTTLEKLKELPEGAHTPVIFLTAKTQTSEVQHYQALGAIDVISKPFDPMTLAQQVREAWSKRHG